MIDWSIHPHCVYGIVEAGEIIYVGFTCNPKQRLQTHKAKKLCSKAATIKIIGWYKGIGRARQYEEYYIGKLMPRKNIWGVRVPRVMARRIWFGYPGLSNDQVADLMPGWTKWSAYNAFGNRMSFHHPGWQNGASVVRVRRKLVPPSRREVREAIKRLEERSRDANLIAFPDRGAGRPRKPKL